MSMFIYVHRKEDIHTVMYMGIHAQSTNVNRCINSYLCTFEHPNILYWYVCLHLYLFEWIPCLYVSLLYTKMQGILTEGGSLSTVDLLIKVACFVKNVNDIFNIKRNLSKQANTRRLTVLSLPFCKVSLRDVSIQYFWVFKRT